MAKEYASAYKKLLLYFMGESDPLIRCSSG